MDDLFGGNTVNAQRVIYTPSPFARSGLLHLQETGILTATSPHTSRRRGLGSYLLFAVLSGSGELEYKGSAQRLTAGDCVFIDCTRPYAHRSSEDLWTLRWAHFYGPGMGEIYGKYTQRGGEPVFRPESLTEIVAELERLQAVAVAEDHIRDMRINESLARLLTLIMEQSWRQEGAGQVPANKRDMRQIREYLDEHLEEKITLDDLAARFYINKFYLTRMFREQFGLPVNSYIARQRVTRAKRLLRYSDMTVEQIAASCGVSDPNYFSRMFRKVEGVSPAEYRKLW